MEKLSMITDFVPAGDQPQEISDLVKGLEKGKEHQVFLGVTGSGKPFTIANVIERVQRPAMIIEHKKALFR
jgi:excinuclease ABC subunit B